LSLALLSTGSCWTLILSVEEWEDAANAGTDNTRIVASCVLQHQLPASLPAERPELANQKSSSDPAWLADSSNVAIGVDEAI
jgi:hypothetical protein